MDEEFRFSRSRTAAKGRFSLEFGRFLYESFPVGEFLAFYLIHKEKRKVSILIKEGIFKRIFLCAN